MSPGNYRYCIFLTPFCQNGIKIPTVPVSNFIEWTKMLWQKSVEAIFTYTVFIQVFWIRIRIESAFDRIRIQKSDPDPGGIKRAKMKKKRSQKTFLN
jgi:hypothetical protein